jgi:hypothetical protein
VSRGGSTGSHTALTASRASSSRCRPQDQWVLKNPENVLAVVAFKSLAGVVAHGALKGLEEVAVVDGRRLGSSRSSACVRVRSRCCGPIERILQRQRAAFGAPQPLRGQGHALPGAGSAEPNAVQEPDLIGPRYLQSGIAFYVVTVMNPRAPRCRAGAADLTSCSKISNPEPLELDIRP